MVGGTVTRNYMRTQSTTEFFLPQLILADLCDLLKLESIIYNYRDIVVICFIQKCMTSYMTRAFQLIGPASRKNWFSPVQMMS